TAKRKQVRHWDLTPLATVRLVQSGIEEAQRHIVAGEQQLLGSGERDASRKRGALTSHRGRGVDQEMVQAAGFSLALLARVVQDLVFEQAARQFGFVPGELREDEGVDAAAARQSGVTEGRVGAGGGLALRFQNPR